MRQLEDLEVRFMPFGNRQISAKQVSLLKLKIQRHGIMRVLQLIKTNKFGEGMHYYIKDGQHLYTACMALGIAEQLYIVIDSYKYKNTVEIVHNVADINSDQKGWRLPDFIASFASTNQLLDYNVLQNRCISYGLPPQLTAMIYGGLSSTVASQIIKSGNFKVIDLEKGDKICKLLQDVVLLFGRANTIILRQFTFAFYNWYNSVTYNHNIFMSFIRENKEKMALMKTNEIEILLQKVPQ